VHNGNVLLYSCAHNYLSLKEMNWMEQLGDLLILIHKNLKTQLERELKEYEIGMGQLQVLMVFYSNKQAMLTQSELAKEMDVDKGNVSRSVEKLLAKEYIVKAPSNGKQYMLSEKGVKLKSELISKFIKLDSIMTRGINQEEQKHLINILSNISRNLENNR